MFQKILIANRGEIACRVIRTAKRLGIATVAIYSEADKNALHTQLADEAFCVGPAPSIDSYLQQEKIIAIAKQTGAQAIHPGYGFLSENAAFSELCAQSGIEFIGPPSSAIVAMGSKSNAKALMEKANVPLLPGYHGADQSSETLLSEANKIGFPLLIKPAAGGGGKGMHIVHSSKEMAEKIQSSKREAKASFGDDTLLLEKYLAAPKHIEIQIIADKLGTCVHCSERDCSTQRRHQKIIEEAPAAILTKKLREEMGQAAVNCAKAIGYVGAGTVEFLLTDDGFYFMEMNTRLQVEHPVTEMILGVDLVEWQLRIAANEPLLVQQKDLKVNGHAIEARVYAEDPNAQFLPSIGQLRYCHFPKNTDHWRIDTGVQQGAEVSMYYDPMLAKVICWGETRDLAIAELQRCLQQCHIVGVTTNIDFLLTLLNHPQFKQSGFSTNYIDNHLSELIQPRSYSAFELAVFALFFYLQQSVVVDEADPYSPWQDLSNWQSNLSVPMQIEFQTDETNLMKAKLSRTVDGFIVQIADETVELNGELQEIFTVFHQQQRTQYQPVLVDKRWYLFGAGLSMMAYQQDPLERYAQTQTRGGHFNAPMPGTVVAIMVQPGTYVEKGTSLMVIEAMKMEHTISAPKDGVVSEIYYRQGDIVQEGVELLAFASDAE